MSEQQFAAGQCLCGAVHYTISAAPVRMVQCHCDDCRKATGTGHVSNAFFKKEAVVIQGETRSYSSQADGGATMTRDFCPVCGSNLFGFNSASDKVIGISVGTVDDSSWFKPDLIVYHKRKPGWDFMDESVPSFDEMPPS